MAYFISLKYLDSLEDFRKNPHVKIPPKSPPTNFQSLGIFKNQILFGKEFFLHSRPSSQLAHPAFWPSRGPFFFFQPAIFLPPPHWASADPAHRHGPTTVFFLLTAPAERRLFLLLTCAAATTEAPCPPLSFLKNPVE
jgi:hypothetical protein